MMDKLTEKTLSSMILSASGWRGIFAIDGEEESAANQISEQHQYIAAAAAMAFSAYLKKRGRNSEIICAQDTRPTGGAIANVVINTLISEERNVIYPGVCAAPEIMAYAKYLGDEGAAGFIYISASHNPVGYNGLKFGLCDGGVLSGYEAAALLDVFRKIIFSENKIAVNAGAIPLDLTQAIPLRKKETGKIYFDFTREVISGTADKNESDEIFSEIKRGLKDRPLGIVADFNGSARITSIDKEFLEGLGVKFSAVNDKCGEFQHAIVPEGSSLDTCRKFLEERRREDNSFVFGYVPDCDGDRGNLVFYDEDFSRSRALEAQEVFALACIAELSYLVWKGEAKCDSNGKSQTTAASVVKTAIAVNDPTSYRIDKIAEAFGASVFRAEVGEANVVSLARKLREEGWLVRILGEGSNGGNITHPSAVRDPLNTIGSILKLLCIRKTNGKKGLFEIWCTLSGQAEKYRDDFTLTDIINSIPAYVSTGAFSEDAVVKVVTKDQGLLKKHYQEIFLKEWDKKKADLKKNYRIAEWEATAYNGIIEKKHLNDFAEAEKGGLKIVFRNDKGRKTASLWMRGSATEPVLRVMADVEGTDEKPERELIAWQRKMIMEADRMED